MVWFYPEIVDKLGVVRKAVEYSFQSHYGLILSRETDRVERLVLWRQLLSIPLWSDFIYIVNGSNCDAIVIFQSHYGLILSRRPQRVRKLAVSFQSHYGLILSVFFSNHALRVLYAFNPTMVWFYRWRTPISNIHSEKLSIPLWSDFIILESITEMEEIGIFQSHYGLILSKS